jgi:hypothetical protein
MIDWASETWGGGVHFAANGSWVNDKHGDDNGSRPATRRRHREAPAGEGFPGAAAVAFRRATGTKED